MFDVCTGLRQDTNLHGCHPVGRASWACQVCVQTVSLAEERVRMIDATSTDERRDAADHHLVASLPCVGRWPEKSLHIADGTWPPLLAKDACLSNRKAGCLDRSPQRCDSGVLPHCPSARTQPSVDPRVGVHHQPPQPLQRHPLKGSLVDRMAQADQRPERGLEPFAFAALVPARPLCGRGVTYWIAITRSRPPLLASYMA